MKTALQPDERIIYFARQHWVIYCMAVVAAVAVAVAGYAFGGIVVALITGWLTLFYFYLLRRNNIWVVTNKRFIDENGVFVVTTKETPLDKINNAGYKKTPIGMILGFGNVSIQSAAEAGVTVAKWVPRPERLVEAIQTAQAMSGRVDEEEVIECPFCRERIKKGAVLCRFCGSRLVEQERPVETAKPVTSELQHAEKEETVLNEEKQSETVLNEKNNPYRRKADLWRPGK